MLRKPLCRIAPFLFGLLLAAGCSSSSAPESKPPSNDIRFGDIKAMLDDFQKKKGRPPARAEDLIFLEPNYPLGYQSLASKRVVYAWGVALGSGSSVLAYSADAAEKGGTVLLEDGTIKDMTAAEFQAAPKAKK